MLADWFGNSFPKLVPSDYELEKNDDTKEVHKFIKSKKNCF